ncbi:unnamed protein product, partial [marine sediment metagenome]
RYSSTILETVTSLSAALIFILGIRHRKDIYDVLGNREGN